MRGGIKFVLMFLLIMTAIWVSAWAQADGVLKLTASATPSTAGDPRERALEVLAAVIGPFEPGAITDMQVWRRTFDDPMLGCWPPGARRESDYVAVATPGWMALIRVNDWALYDVRLAETYGFLCTVRSPEKTGAGNPPQDGIGPRKVGGRFT